VFALGSAPPHPKADEGAAVEHRAVEEGLKYVDDDAPVAVQVVAVRLECADVDEKPPEIHDGDDLASESKRLRAMATYSGEQKLAPQHFSRT